MNGLASIFTRVAACSFCDKSEGHEPWCQVSPEWIAMEAVYTIAEGISEVTTIETLYALAKQQPRTECLTLEMVREMVTSWVDDCGEWELVHGQCRKVPISAGPANTTAFAPVTKLVSMETGVLETWKPAADALHKEF